MGRQPRNLFSGHGRMGRHQHLVVRQGRELMAAWLIAFIGVVYMIVALQLMIEGKVGLSIAFIGYSLGNVGLYIAAKNG